VSYRQDKIDGGTRLPIQIRENAPDWLDPERWTPLPDGRKIWPRPGLRGVPPLETAEILGRTVGVQQPELSDPFLLAEALEVPIRFKKLGAERRGIEALIVPGGRSRFEIICDPWCPITDPSRQRFRVAHELAHTLFYDWAAAPPQKISAGGRDEEDFCDQFAAALLAFAG
jgi:hypothetical protein